LRFRAGILGAIATPTLLLAQPPAVVSPTAGIPDAPRIPTRDERLSSSPFGAIAVPRVHFDRELLPTPRLAAPPRLELVSDSPEVALPKAIPAQLPPVAPAVEAIAAPRLVEVPKANRSAPPGPLPIPIPPSDGLAPTKSVLEGTPGLPPNVPAMLPPIQELPQLPAVPVIPEPKSQPEGKVESKPKPPKKPEFRPILPPVEGSMSKLPSQLPEIPLPEPPGPQAQVARTPPSLFPPSTVVPSASPAFVPSFGPASTFEASRVPGHPRPQSLLGNFPVLPTGPGYYSLLDVLRGEARSAPPKIPLGRFGLQSQPAFDADWRYLDDPANTENDLSDILKRIPLGDNWLLSLGGNSSLRYMNEGNSRLRGIDQDYLLSRQRLYADLWYRDVARFYVEGIWADSRGGTLPPLPADRTGVDFLNLFVDLKVTEFLNKPVYLRLGRQELLFGSQRLISTNDWANTRQTFQGARLTRTGQNWDFDAFWVQPVFPNSSRLDESDHRQNLAGIWASYRPDKHSVLDLYNLTFDNRNRGALLGTQRGRFTVNTLGGRYAGAADQGFLWDFEGAVQLGSQGANAVAAYMATTGVGYNAKCLPWSPSFWAYYDYASGDNNPGGTNSTFHQLFPYGHYYLGWADQVGRQNIHDLNFHVYAYPAKWITLWAQYHNFWLASNRDALYNAAGVAIRRDPTGRAGSFVGQELDFVANFHLTNRDDLLLGYSRLFGGDFLRRTAAPGAPLDSSLFFMQYNLRW
jgi:hypothetical protein